MGSESNSKEGELYFHTSANTRTSAVLCRGEVWLALNNICFGNFSFVFLLYTKKANFGSLQAIFFSKLSLTPTRGSGSPLTSIGFLGKEGEKEAARQLDLL